MAIKKSRLYAKLWQACDELRGGMDASQYKDYVLTLLFVKYISDRARSGDGGLLIDLPGGCAFADLAALKGRPDIGERVNVVLARIGEANPQLGTTLSTADFADEQKLGKGRDLVETVSNLIGIFQDRDLDLSNNRAADDDLIGDAYEYLMKNFATQSGKSKGQFYTPGEVSRVMARLTGIARDPRPKISIYDMACGSGSLLIRAAAESGRPFDAISIEGQELDVATIGMARMSMVIHGIDDAELKHGNTLTAPLHRRDDTHLRQFDYAFANPPFSVKGWMKGSPENDPFGRWGRTGGLPPVPPPKCGDYAFLLHMVASLKSTGRGAIILPHGVLFRGNAEGAIRRWLVERCIVSGIVGLPPNLFFGTGIPACILLLDKGAAAASGGIFMIDAKDGYAKDGAKNRLRESDIRRIVDAWEARAEIPHYSRFVPQAEIEANGCNLNLPRYIVPAGRGTPQNLAAHLGGGVPADEAAAFPACLFRPLRPGFVRPAAPVDALSGLLAADSGLRAAERRFGEAVDAALAAFADSASAIGRGCNPRELGAAWGDRLFEAFRGADPCADPYDLYEAFMQYWAETLQDDCFLVSRDGWRLDFRPPARRNGTWKDFVCDLLPPDTAVAAAFPAEKARLDALQARLDDAAGRLDALSEAADPDAEEEDDASWTDAVLVAESSADVRAAALEKEIRALKRALKEANADLAAKLLRHYQTLSAPELKREVVEAKWCPALRTRLLAVRSAALRRLGADAESLAARYAESLPELEAAAAAARDKVMAHLKDMGVGE